MTKRTLFATLLLLTTTSPAMAQLRAPHWSGSTNGAVDTPLMLGSAHRWEAAAPTVQTSPRSGLIVGALLGGALGIAAGGAIGYAMMKPSDGVSLEPVMGALIGESLLLPLGVYLANGMEGSYGWMAAGSVGIMMGGVLLALPTAGLSLLAMPVAQTWLSIRVAQAASPALP